MTLEEENKKLHEILHSYESEHDTVFREWSKDLRNYKQLKRNVEMAITMLNEFEENFGFDYLIEEIKDMLNENMK